MSLARGIYQTLHPISIDTLRGIFTVSPNPISGPAPPPPLQLASSKWSRTHFGTHHTSFEAQILPILRGSSLHLDSELNKDKPEANRSGPVLFYYLPINYPESKAQIGWVWVRIMQRSALLVCHMENETLLF